MTGLKIDPWCRIHEDDVCEGTPATIYRGARYGLLDEERYGSLRNGEAIMCWPATVTAVARGDDGALEQMLIRNEQTQDVHYFTRRHMPLVRTGYDSRREGWFGAEGGWLVVVGVRAIAERCYSCARKRVDTVAITTVGGEDIVVCAQCYCGCGRGPKCTCQPCGCEDADHRSCGLGDRL